MNHLTREEAVEILDTVPAFDKPRAYWAQLAERFVGFEMYAEARDAMLKAQDVSFDRRLRDTAGLMAACFDHFHKQRGEI